MISLIIGCMEASIEIMKKLIPIVLMIMYYAFIVLPVAIIRGIVEVVKKLICYFKGKEYVPPQEPEISYEVKVEPERKKPVKHLRATAYKVKYKNDKKRYEPFSIEEMMLYDIIDGD